MGHGPHNMDTIDFLPCGHSTHTQLSVLAIRGTAAYAEVSRHTLPDFPRLTCSCGLCDTIKSRNNLGSSPKRTERFHGRYQIISIIADHHLLGCMDRNSERSQVLARLFGKHFRARYETGNQQRMTISTLQSTSSKISWNRHVLNWPPELGLSSKTLRLCSSRILHAFQSVAFRKTLPAWIQSNTRSRSKAHHPLLR